LFSVTHFERTVKLGNAGAALQECVDESTAANDSFRRANNVEPPPLGYMLHNWRERYNWSGVPGALCDAGWFAFGVKDGVVMDGGIRSPILALWVLPRNMMPLSLSVAALQARPAAVAPLRPTPPSQVRLLLLVGLPGSGKSTLASRLQGWTRINQDDEGSRPACEARLAKVAARPTGRAVLDRCNISVEQRQVWLDFAREHAWVVHCIVFDWPVDVCIQRCVQREGHPTIEQHNLEKASNIVHTMCHSMHAPRYQEGIELIHVASCDADVERLVQMYSARDALLEQEAE